MFRKLKAGVINMAKSIMNAKQEERENKCRLVKTITKGVVNGLNYDGNKNLRKVAVVMIGAGLTVAVLSYIK
jgi:hypothetical protein